MSRNDKKKPKTANEPWEQSIYDTDYEQNVSRSQQRKGKKGNTMFLTMLVILLFLIAAIPTGVYIWWLNDNKTTPNTQTATTTTISKETKESSTSSQASSSSTEQTSASSTAENNENQDNNQAENGNADQNTNQNTNQNTEQDTNQNTDQNTNQNADQTAGNQSEEYTTVQNGEGPDQIAARTGVSVETIYELNGMSPDNYFLSPGDSIRIK